MLVLVLSFLTIYLFLLSYFSVSLFPFYVFAIKFYSFSPFEISVLLHSFSHSSLINFFSVFANFLLPFNPCYFPLSCLLLTDVPSSLSSGVGKNLKYVLTENLSCHCCKYGTASLHIGSSYLHKYRTLITVRV
jgi:hypothetical protein